MESVKTREEKDTMGVMHVPVDALYGASTQRAVENFPISGHKMPTDFISCMGLLKYACAEANRELGFLSDEKAQAIKTAAWEVYEEKLNEHFPVDVFQTGSCTSSNMNVNEVIANRVTQMQGGEVGKARTIHPNDDVNLGQSSNDTMPTVLHMSIAMALKHKLKPAMELLEAQLNEKAKAWASIIKIGRTHLMDATPLSLGQEFSGYAHQAKKGIERVNKAISALEELALGGTAVGTGINCHAQFPKKVIRILNEKSKMNFREADNHFEAQAARDDCVEVAGYLSTIASSLTKIANDIRLMGSGPRSGIFELMVPATQPGSSIMPGKVNPVMSEMLVQVCIYVMGLCQSVVIAGRDGHFELNVTIPVIGYSLLESIQCLSKGITTFVERCLSGLEPNAERCRELVDRSLMLVTALNPYIGYEKACHVAKRAFAEDKTLMDIILEEKLMEEDLARETLNPEKMVLSESISG